MSNTVLLTLGRELDVNGVTVPGAKAYFYEAGTTTPITVYTDTAASIAHPSPVEADAGGLFPACYVTASTAKAVITKADDSALRTIDPCPILSVSGVGASGVSFTPTVDIPATNVQDAIVLAAATAAAGFAAFGLGITGNAPTLADIDATNIGSGEYRTTAATTGTFPTGITAVSTSIIAVLRETSALAVMHLLDDTQGRSWTRWMVASVWGAWKENITMPMASATGAVSVMGASGPTVATPSVAGQVPLWNGTSVVYTAKRVFSPAVALSGLSTSSSAGLFSGSTNVPTWASAMGVLFINVKPSTVAQFRIRIGDSSSFLSTGYLSFSGNDGGGDYSETTAFGILNDPGAAKTLSGRISIYRPVGAASDHISDHTLATVDGLTPITGGGHIVAANLSGKTIDRMQLSLNVAGTFTQGSAYFWYE